jgi:hypothetical protein
MEDFSLSDKKAVAGLSALVKSDEYNAQDFEREILSGANIAQEEEDNAAAFKHDMDRLGTTYGLAEMDLESNIGEDIKFDPDLFSANIENEAIKDDQLNYMTMEQKKQNHVNNVLQDIDNDEDLEYDIDKERDDDDKNVLLEQIDMLRDTLGDDGINVSNVPVVTKSNSISDIKTIYKSLRLKSDRNRYCSFAEELILSAAYGVEYLFDGKNEWFGRKPDLVGWSNTVRIKLRRCRFQTSSLIKDMMQDYSIGPAVQICLELIPSLFLYSRQKKISNNEFSNANDSAAYDNAVSNLNEIQS